VLFMEDAALLAAVIFEPTGEFLASVAFLFIYAEVASQVFSHTVEPRTLMLADAPTLPAGSKPASAFTSPTRTSFLLPNTLAVIEPSAAPSALISVPSIPILAMASYDMPALSPTLKLLPPMVYFHALFPLALHSTLLRKDPHDASSFSISDSPSKPCAFHKVIVLLSS